MEIYQNVKLCESKLNELADAAKDWCTLHGVVMRNNDNKTLTNFAPMMLLPSPFPKYLYEEAKIVQTDFQTLIYQASIDHEFIENALKSVIVHDAFTKKQYEIYEKVCLEGIKQKYVFNLTRSDYMLNEAKGDTNNGRRYEIKQIEINVIAASFGGLGSHIFQLHKYMSAIMGDDAPYKIDQVVENTTIWKLGEGVAKFWKLYGKDNAVVIFVIQEGDCNKFDQRLLEYSFHESISKLGVSHHVHVLFRSINQIYKTGKLNENRECFVEGHEVALFYFRSCYVPSDYMNDEAWDARLMVERSIAAKCPTMAVNLIGTKKVQQVFAAPGMVERFISDPEAVKRVRRTFARLYSLDEGVDGDAAAEMALENPSKYVLKPQREGGGNNMYDEKMVAELKRATDPLVRSQYILMERVRPPIVPNYIIHANFDKPKLANTVTELGIFGTFIAVNDEVVHNETAGHLMRTKDNSDKDGGVVAGVAVLDTPCLI